MVAPGAFSLADIRDLATRPDKFPGERNGKGFSFPQRGWAYRGADSFYLSGRQPGAIKDALAAALVGGIGITPWKRAQIARLATDLGVMVALDSKSGGDYLGSQFKNPVEVVAWQGHALRLPSRQCLRRHGPSHANRSHRSVQRREVR